MAQAALQGDPVPGGDVPPGLPPVRRHGETSTRQALVRLIRYSRPYIAAIALALCFSMLYSAGRYGRAYLIKPLLDDVLMPHAASETASGAEASSTGWLFGSGGEADAPPAQAAAPAPMAAASDPAALAPAQAGTDPAADMPSQPGTDPAADAPSQPGTDPAALAPAQAEAGARVPDVSERMEVFRKVVWAGVLIMILVPVAIFAQGYLMEYVVGRISVDLKRQLAEKVLRLPLAFHRDTSSGDTVTRLLLDVQMSQKLFKLLFMDFFQSVVMIGIGVTTFFVISWQLSLVSLVLVPLIMGVLAYFSGKIRKTAKRRQEQLAEVTQRLLGILSGIKVIKAFRGESLEAEAFGRENYKHFRRSMKVVKNRVLSRSLTEMLNNGVAIVVLMLGTALVLSSRWGLTAGDVAAFAAVLATTYKPIKDLAKGWVQITDGLSSADRFFELLDLPEETPDAEDAVEIDGVHRSIRFEGVSFSYGREPVIRNLDLEIAAGEVVAVVGPTGAGKSTLVDLLLRFHDPDAGSITIDGIDLRRIARRSLLDQIAVVSQEPFLFDASIRENVRYGYTDATEEEFLAACRIAHVDEFVDQLPEGYETEVGEFGLRLSGGQRQRITIARAILKRCGLLVFDEATSSLDSKTERTVQNAIETQRGAHTVFVIAHRLSTVRRADRILVLENGAITEEGRHEELMAKGGLYRELVAISGEGE